MMQNLQAKPITDTWVIADWDGYYWIQKKQGFHWILSSEPRRWWGVNCELSGSNKGY